MNGMRFESPWWLLVLIPLGGLWWYGRRRSQVHSVAFSSLALLHGAPRSLRQRLAVVARLLRPLALLCVAVALSRPQRGEEEFRIRSSGLDILMCIDRSGSMNAMDFQEHGERVDRLRAVKRAFEEFVLGDGEDLAGRPDDRIGLVVFGGFAESRCPLTLDHDALQRILEGVHTPERAVDDRGRPIDDEFYRLESSTAIGDALALSVGRLRAASGKSKVVILLSDGENTAGSVDPRTAARLAAQSGVKVYTIGVGSNGPAPFPAIDAFGRSVLQMQPVTLDEELLKEIATTTGGLYFNARDSESLAAVYASIDELEKSEVEGAVYTEYRELFPYWLWPGLGLLLIEFLCSLTWWRTLP